MLPSKIESLTSLSHNNKEPEEPLLLEALEAALEAIPAEVEEVMLLLLVDPEEGKMTIKKTQGGGNTQ